MSDHADRQNEPTKNKKQKGEQKLFALWTYSGSICTSPTTVLGSPINYFESDGMAVLDGYGGARFKPELVLPLDAGQKALEEFDALRKEHEAALLKTHKEWTLKYTALRKKYGLSRKDQ